MSIDAYSLKERVSTTLFDPDTVRWTPEELDSYLLSAMEALCSYKPDLFTRPEWVVPIFSGAKQYIDINGDGFVIQLVSVDRYEKADGTGTRSVFHVDRNHMESTDPEWYTASGDYVEAYVYDPRSPVEIWIYPSDIGSDGDNPDILYTTVVVSPLSEDYIEYGEAGIDTIYIPDIYDNFLYYWMLSLCFAKQFKTGDMSKTNAYQQMATQIIGVRTQTQAPWSPQLADKAGTE